VTRHLRNRLFLVGIAVLQGGPGAGAGVASVDSATTIPGLAALPRAIVRVDRERDEFTIELLPIDVGAAPLGGETMVNFPIHQVVVPVSCSIYAARVQALDQAGHILRPSLLHHFNLTDPTRRDLFLPVSLHILAVSKETPPLHIPPLVLGLPLAQGQRLLAGAMVDNETRISYPGLRVRLVLGCRSTRTGLLGSLFPLFRVYPWALDAMFPLGKGPDGSKAFDLPPGRTAKSWESSPAVPGTIVGIGGHVHDHAVSLEFADATTGVVIWHEKPIQDEQGRVTAMPVKRFYSWYRLGLHIVPTHKYRITVVYENPTNDVIPDGGMGAVAGLFVPDRGTRWPPVDVANPVYRQDLAETFVAGSMRMKSE
jgi:hypothetical protein